MKKYYQACTQKFLFLGPKIEEIEVWRQGVAPENYLNKLVKPKKVMRTLEDVRWSHDRRIPGGSGQWKEEGSNEHEMRCNKFCPVDGIKLGLDGMPTTEKDASIGCNAQGS